MPRIILRLGLLLGLAGSFTLTTTARAATTCDDQLGELATMEAALEELVQAVDRSAVELRSLRAHAHALSIAIADQQREGADPAVIKRMQTERAEAVNELARRQALRPKLERQREALAGAVDQARRDYIACVGASLGG